MLMIRHEILRYELSGSGAPNVNFRKISVGRRFEMFSGFELYSR